MPIDVPPAVAIGFFPKATRLAAGVVSRSSVVEVCSASECISPGPDAWIDRWLHNDWGYYDTEALARQVIPSGESSYDLYAFRLAPIRWVSGGLEPLAVQSEADDVPSGYEFLGFDVVSKSVADFFEHSPLSCNDGAQIFPANRYCLIDDAATAFQVLEAIGRDGHYEPGPYYLFEVHRKRTPDWPRSLSAAAANGLAAIVPDKAAAIVEDTWESGAPRVVRYEVEGITMARRVVAETGAVALEYVVVDGRPHGPYRTYHDNGHQQLVSSYRYGKEHGVACQYDSDGHLIGSYEMADGTGLDLWYAAEAVLAEERTMLDGERHGYERWWNDDGTTVSEEGHFWHGEAHGVFRQWNERGRLRRGYPRYFVRGEKVTRTQYEHACRSDATLPAFTAGDNLPQRPLPQRAPV